jgi:hypothetical protein
MSKIDIFCLVRKKVIRVDKKLGDALVKMRRASYDTKVENIYPNKMMTSEPVVPAQQEEKPVVRRTRSKKKDEVVEENDTIEDEVIAPVENTEVSVENN